MDKDKKIRLLITIQMAIIAISAVSIPALITTFQKEYGLSIAQSSIIPIISTLGGFVTNLIVASVSARYGLRRQNLWFITIGFIGAAILGIVSNIFLFLAGITLIGITTAFGLSNTSTIFAHIKPEYQNYGVFHAFFGVGGIIAPGIIGFLLAHQINYRYFYYFLMLIYLINFLVVKYTKLIEDKKYERIRLKEAFHIIRKRFVLPVLIIIALQAGSEQGIVTWSGNLFSDGLRFSGETASLFLSFYWLAFTVSRLLSGIAEKGLGKLNTSQLCEIFIILTILLLLLSRSPIFFIALAIAVGPVFPLIQKYAAQKLPDREVGLFNGLVFAVTSIGNVFIAGLMGWIGDYDIRLSYIVPMSSAIIVIIILIYLNYLKNSGIVKVGRN